MHTCCVFRMSPGGACIIGLPGGIHGAGCCGWCLFPCCWGLECSHVATLEELFVVSEVPSLGGFVVFSQVQRMLHAWDCL